MAERVSLSPRVAPPATVGVFRLAGEPRRIMPAGIFDYMDGGGELYLAYGLEHVDVCEYATRTSGEQGILVEIYKVRTSDDAYGLLSQDWGGEAVALAAGWPSAERRALYGAGLLRIWTGDVFVRVMAALETPASREAVLAIGRALVVDRPHAAPPALVGAIPVLVNGRFRARLDRHVYLRSHLVLNAAFFVATANILDLGPEVEAVVVPYDDIQAAGQPPRPRSLVVRYASADTARRALAHFRDAYLPGTQQAERRVVKIEDGWTGWRLRGRGLVVVFAAPEEHTAAALLDAVTADALDGASRP